MAESFWGWIRRFLVRKQLMIFLCMIAVGVALVVANEWTGDRVGDGIAFIIVGFVGILMSWTTFDIGAGIKEVVREVGRQNKEVVREVGRQNKEALDSLAESQDKISKSQDRLAESQEKIAGILTRIEKKMDKED